MEGKNVIVGTVYARGESWLYFDKKNFPFGDGKTEVFTFASSGYICPLLNGGDGSVCVST